MSWPPNEKRYEKDAFHKHINWLTEKFWTKPILFILYDRACLQNVEQVQESPTAKELSPSLSPFAAVNRRHHLL